MFIGVKQATGQGYIECRMGGVVDLSNPSSKTRRGRVQGGGWNKSYYYNKLWGVQNHGKES